MQTAEQDAFDFDNVDNFRPPEEKFPDVCCRECKHGSRPAHRNLIYCPCHGIFVDDADTCDEAEI